MNIKRLNKYLNDLLEDQNDLNTQAEISKNALIKDESISEKLISNRRFRKNKKSEVDRLPENNTLDEIKAKLNKIPPEYYNKINDFLTSLKK